MNKVDIKCKNNVIPAKNNKNTKFTNSVDPSIDISLFYEYSQSRYRI